MTTHEYAFDGTPYPTGRPWRVSIHTADGWIIYGFYATYRGARTATNNATGKYGSISVASRVGGHDRTYAMSSDMSQHGWTDDRVFRVPAHGCFCPEWSSHPAREYDYSF